MSKIAERRLKMARIHAGWNKGNVRVLDIRAGDTVEVIAGKDKGKRGTVLRSFPEQQRIRIQGINLVKRHVKAGVRGNAQGGIVDFNAPIAYSNVLLVCNRCDKPTRISRQLQPDGTRVIVCKNCGEHYERTQPS